MNSFLQEFSISNSNLINPANTNESYFGIEERSMTVIKGDNKRKGIKPKIPIVPKQIAKPPTSLPLKSKHLPSQATNL